MEKSCEEKGKNGIKHLVVSQLVSIFALFLVQCYARM